MKKQFLNAIVILGLASFMTACSGGSKNADGTGSDSTKTEKNDKADVKGKYQIKSGIITFASETMGMSQNVTIYFDDYGNKECTETTGEMMGIKSHNLSLTKDGFMYSIDLTNKTGTKMKTNINAQKNKDIDFSSLSEEMMKQMHIKKLGTETFLGKTCDKYSIDDPAMKMKGTYVVWNGISLKSEIDMSGIGIKLIAKKIEENATIPADRFEVPKDIKITEIK
jgi:outer membrane lipoprotein-sorting protein